jgi:hypothetical protein
MMAVERRQRKGLFVVFALAVWIVGWHLDSKIAEATWDAEFAASIAQDAQYTADKAQEEAEAASSRIDRICWSIDC